MISVAAASMAFVVRRHAPAHDDLAAAVLVDGQQAAGDRSLDVGDL
jgi:hypothetical protein